MRPPDPRKGPFRPRTTPEPQPLDFSEVAFGDGAPLRDVYIPSTAFGRRPNAVNNKYIKLRNGERWNAGTFGTAKRRSRVCSPAPSTPGKAGTRKARAGEQTRDLARRGRPQIGTGDEKVPNLLEVKEKSALYNKIKQELKLLLFNNRSLITAE